MTFGTPVNAGIAGPAVDSPLVIPTVISAGEEYVLCLARESANDPFIGVTDNGDNEWEYLGHAPLSGTAGRRAEMWHCVTTASATAITADFTGSGRATAVLVRVPGGSGVVNAFNADVRTSGQGTAPPPVNLTPTVANTMLIAFVMANPNGVSDITVPPGWTGVGGEPSVGPKVAYQYAPPKDIAVGCAWVFASAAGSGHAIVALEESAVEPPPSGSFTWWDGTTEEPVTLEGFFNGTTVEPITFDMVTS